MVKLRSFVLVAVAASSFGAASLAADSWNGTWAGGSPAGDAAQIIFADDTLVGFFWDGDYLSVVSAKAANGGAVVNIVWAAGTATLTRDGPMTAHLTVQEKGKPPVTVTVTPDT
jgi:hypothetical protein